MRCIECRLVVVISTQSHSMSSQGQGRSHSECCEAERCSQRCRMDVVRLSSRTLGSTDADDTAIFFGTFGSKSASRLPCYGYADIIRDILPSCPAVSSLRDATLAVARMFLGRSTCSQALLASAAVNHVTAVAKLRADLTSSRPSDATIMTVFLLDFYEVPVPGTSLNKAVLAKACV